MCGRFSLQKSKQKVRKTFSAELGDVELTANADIRPSEDIVIVRGTDGGNELASLPWGLPVSWQPQLMVNARAETVHEKKTFKTAFHTRRCLIPMDGYYEWKNRQRYFITLEGEELFAMAGLWGHASDGNHVVSLTVAANAAIAGVHHRMPAIIKPEHYQRWLNPFDVSAEELLPLLKPYDPTFVRVESVKSAVSL